MSINDTQWSAGARNATLIRIAAALETIAGSLGEPEPTEQPDLPEVRPHVLGAYEALPLVEDDTACGLCGKTGAHDIISLGVDDTARIVFDMRPFG